VTPIDDQILIDGINQLRYGRRSSKLEELWIAKGLYCPVNVVDSLILAVLYKAKETGLMDPLRTWERELIATEITMEGGYDELG